MKLSNILSPILSPILKLDRRIIFLVTLIAISLPLVYDYSITPARMETAEIAYGKLDEIQNNSFVLVAIDWDPSAQSENRPQTEVIIEHLMRKRIPFGVISQIALSAPFLEQIPRNIATKLELETGEKWQYGVDWVNFGYRPGGTIMIQKFAKSEDLHKFFQTDASSVPIKDFAIMKDIKTIKDIQALAQITGFVGTFNSWLQFFRNDGHVPMMIHGCTAITIPEAYNYFLTNQISGLFEGVAGAAWYDELLSRNYKTRKPGSALKTTTALSIGNILIIVFIILGNLQELIKKFKRGN